MSSTNSAPGMLWRFALVSRSFLSQPGLPYAEALPEERIEQAFAAEEIDFASPRVDEDEVVYTPAVTLRAFLSQMLHADEQRSCLAAVARVAVLWAALGKHVCASNSGGYCRARAKLTESVLERLARELADKCERTQPRIDAIFSGELPRARLRTILQRTRQLASLARIDSSDNHRRSLRDNLFLASLPSISS